MKEGNRKRDGAGIRKQTAQLKDTSPGFKMMLMSYKRIARELYRSVN